MASSRVPFLVLDFTHHPIDGARVVVRSATAYTDSTGRAALDNAAGHEVIVQTRGWETLVRDPERKDANRAQMFTLGRPGMPYHYRGKVNVLFAPLPGTIGVLARPPQPPEKAGRSTQEAVDLTAVAERVGGQIVRWGKNSEQSRVVIIRVRETGEEGLARHLRELERDPQGAGAFAASIADAAGGAALDRGDGRRGLRPSTEIPTSRVSVTSRRRAVVAAHAVRKRRKDATSSIRTIAFARSP
jgi:hypothetical protein